MAPSPHQSMPTDHDNTTIDFRAPPPSPVASGRRSFVANDEILTDFLDHSLRVPDLVLPDSIFPRQKIVETPPSIDFQSLASAESNSIRKISDSISRIGCFQLVNYGIPSDSIRLVLAMAAGIFSLSPEKKAAVTRSHDRNYGFEEVHDHGEEECELSTEEFVWCKDKSLKLDMEGLWPTGYSIFSEKMETLMSEIENVAEKILEVIKKHCPRKYPVYGNFDMKQGHDCFVGSVWYLHKQRSKVAEDECLGYDVIRMLIRGTDHSHALCFHICDGSSDEFHVYSKKGWVSFFPEKDAIIVTIGDQIQAMSGGHYKHVLGRPILRGEKDDYISMAFLYNPPSITATTTAAVTATVPAAATIPKNAKTISLGQQVILAFILALAYNFLVYIHKKY